MVAEGPAAHFQSHALSCRRTQARTVAESQSIPCVSAPLSRRCVLRGTGTCVAPDECKCVGGWMGESCGQPDCGADECGHADGRVTPRLHWTDRDRSPRPAADGGGASPSSPRPKPMSVKERMRMFEQR